MKKSILKKALIISTVGLLSCGNESVETTTTITSPVTTIQDTVDSSPLVNTTGLISEDADAQTFKSLVDTGSGILIDVRTPEEYTSGHIEEAVNIDFHGEDFDQNIDLLDKNTPVYVYCQSGGRSGQTKELLKEKGFTAVYNLIGGYGNWPYKE